MSESSNPAPATLSDRVGALLPRTEYRWIKAAADQAAIHRLRYECYLEEGAIDSNSSGRLEDEFDLGINTRVFGIHLDGELASSIRLHLLTCDEAASPAMGVFAECLQPYFGAGKTVLEPTRLVVRSETARLHLELIYLTLRLAFLAAVYFLADIAIATVRLGHQAFYKRVLRYSPLASCRPYPGLKTPLSLLAVDFGANRSEVTKRFPLFSPRDGELQMIFGAPLDRVRATTSKDRSHRHRSNRLRQVAHRRDELILEEERKRAAAAARLAIPKMVEGAAE